MPANYDGNPIFGTAVQMTTAVNPTADQVNSYFGVNGNESLFGGTRGRVTLVQGVLFGDDASGFAAAKALFESYYDGIARNLTDTIGVTYSQVKLESFVPKGRVRVNSFNGVVFQEYNAKFVHMTT